MQLCSYIYHCLKTRLFSKHQEIDLIIVFVCTELRKRKTRIYITECPFKQINVKVNNQGQITVKVKKTHFGSRSITQCIFQNNGFSAHKARCNSKILRIHKSKPPPSELESQLEIGIRNIKERELYQKVRESN